jgi:hypothetical protein
MVNKENYEEYMLLYADGELSEAEVKALHAFVDANPELRSELEAYKATHLVPDTTMVYEHKEKLMKSSGGGKTIALGKWWMYAAAACVILFAVMITRNNNTTTTDSTSVATKETPKTNTPQTMDNPKEFHSTPVKPVSHENAIADVKATSKKQQVKSTQLQIPKQEPIIAKKEEPKQPETQHTPITQPKQEEPVTVKTETQQTPVTQQQPSSANEAIALQRVTDDKNNLLQRLPFNREKTEGVTVFAEAVNERIEKIKEIKDNMKDAEFKFRIGNKELFIVRL